MKKALVVSVILLSLFIELQASAMVPAAQVVAIDLTETEDIPAVCSFLRVSKSVVFLQKSLFGLFSSDIKAPLQQVKIEKGLKYPEDISRIFLVLTEKNCHLFLSKKALPSAKQINSLTGYQPEIENLYSTHNGEVLLQIKNKIIKIPPGSYKCIKSPDTGSCVLKLHNYGILPLYQETPLHPIKTTIDTSHSGMFFGPADRAVFDVKIPQAGTLILEYRSDTGPLLLDSLIKTLDDRVIGTGSATFKAAGPARVTLGYRGIKPTNYDIGFLFIPDIPLACTIEYTMAEDQKSITIKLSVQNISNEPVEAPLPEAGTVVWYSDGRLLSAAVPKRPPRHYLYASGESRFYSVQLPATLIGKTIKARMKTKTYQIECEKEIKDNSTKKLL
ncbi:MAG: hypothetical protein GXO99_02610 [Nitrospirae bacterium]|nr:hypothetical protein [Nitrospirota bacterium]